MKKCKNKYTSTTKKQFILSEFLKSNENSQIWFYVNEVIQDFRKDTSVSEIYAFKKLLNMMAIFTQI